MDALLTKSLDLAAAYGLPGLICAGTLFLTWKSLWLWIAEAQKRAEADLKQAAASEAVARALEALTARIGQERVGQERIGQERGRR